jgi:hypothetical protein
MPGAQQQQDGRIQCLNPLCQNFDPARGKQSAPPQPSTPQTSSAPPPGSTPQAPSTPQNFASRPAAGTVNIWYRNYKGESKNFVADAGSLKRTHNHISARVAPKGKVITLSRDRIQNMHEIDPLLPAWDRSDAPQPTARERQVLGYHKKHGTTSPLYEKIKAKYPLW